MTNLDKSLNNYITHIKFLNLDAGCLFSCSRVQKLLQQYHTALSASFDFYAQFSLLYLEQIIMTSSVTVQRIQLAC